jgi:micrococcal nuclease
VSAAPGRESAQLPSKDRYGRDLRAISRQRPDGSEQSIASDMRQSGLARRYLGGLKSEWC